MPEQHINANNEVTKFLDNLNHPLRSEIELLRQAILNADATLTENIKWNGPNYCFDKEDRITMRIQPPKQVQLIFHCGVKVKEQPKEKLIKDDSGLLVWKENNRAVATFKHIQDIEHGKADLTRIVQDWVIAAK